MGSLAPRQSLGQSLPGLLLLRPSDGRELAIGSWRSVLDPLTFQTAPMSTRQPYRSYFALCSYQAKGGGPRPFATERHQWPSNTMPRSTSLDGWAPNGVRRPGQSQVPRTGPCHGIGHSRTPYVERMSETGAGEIAAQCNCASSTPSVQVGR